MAQTSWAAGVSDVLETQIIESDIGYVGVSSQQVDTDSDIKGWMVG